MSTDVCFAPRKTATGKIVELAMQRLWLTGQILPAGARLFAEHVFQSAEDKPLEVIYAFPLPRDAALRKFRISGEGFEAHSELKEREAAIEAYEEGIRKGSLSTFAQQYGDGLVNLTVGNIRPHETVTVRLEILCGVELRDDGFQFRFPFTLAPGYHPRAKAVTIAPGEGELELPADEFGDVILPGFREDASHLHQVGFDLTLMSGLEFEEIASPSHPLRVRHNDSLSARAALAAESDVPDRDLVLQARFKSTEPQVLSGANSDGRRHFAAVIPSTSFGSKPDSPRRTVILLDRSGSMAGAPIEQARKAIQACLGVLSETDSFGLVAFDDKAGKFTDSLVPGTREHREEARKFLAKVDARGGTELAEGFREAAGMLGDSGGDILLITDGEVFGTETILAKARSTGVRLHCLGIGSASQDRFLALLARETGGVSRFLTPRDRVDISAVDLFASIGRPVASGLRVNKDIQPETPAAVFAGTPVLLFGVLDENDNEDIEITWDGGHVRVPLDGARSDCGDTASLLQGARLITDWESRYPPAEGVATAEKRRQSRVAARLLQLSRTFGLASREMTLVAVVTRKGDREGQLPETRVVPVGMAQDVRFDSQFLAGMSAISIASPLLLKSAPEPQSPPPSTLAARGAFDRLFSLAPSPPREDGVEDLLLSIAARIDADGGLPGKTPELRAGLSALALLAFMSQGHTQTEGAFRLHVARLVNFLKLITGLSSEQQQIIARTLELAGHGAAPPGNWPALARSAKNPWKELARAFSS